ncbi:MAG: hypothetical protein ACK4IT_10550 [Thioalkalivibrionaceae bacterium]
MIDFSITRTLGLLRRTLPFILLRLVIFFSITLAYIIATGGGAGIGYLLDRSSENPAGWTFWGGLTGFGLVSGVIYFLREYLLYLVKAGHIAVLVHLMNDRPIPDGRGQISYATTEVKNRFVESSVLFAIDQLIKGVLKVINGLLMGIATLLPVPALQAIMKFVTTVINLSLTYVDEVILAHNIHTQSTNPWHSSREALVLYAQNYKTMLKNALFLAFIVWGLTAVIFLVVMLPAIGALGLFPGSASVWAFVISLVAAIALKAALVDPFAMAALIQVYFKVTEGQTPNPQWTARLDGASQQFRKMGEKAVGFVAPQTTTPTEPHTAAAGVNNTSLTEPISIDHPRSPDGNGAREATTEHNQGTPPPQR